MRYRVVDVFTQNPLEGNPLAVFPDRTDLDDATMQSIARELNLSETVFVVPSRRADCVARFRIFTPQRELDFAGHPTVGASFVLLDEKAASGERFAVEENVGPVRVRVETGEEARPLIWLTTPAIADGETFDTAFLTELLGLTGSDFADATPQLLSAGNPTILVALKNKEAVDRASLKGGVSLPGCLFVFAPVPEGAYSRMFAPHYGIAEDPATGSSTGPLAAYMIRNGFVSGAPGTRFISEQGVKMKRRSILHVHLSADGIEVGGYTTPLIDATMRL